MKLWDGMTLKTRAVVATGGILLVREGFSARARPVRIPSAD